MSIYRTSPGLNWSLLRHMADSPLAYRHARDAKPTPSTAAQVVGTLCHMRILEPDRYGAEVAIWDGTSTRSKAYTEWAEQQGSRTILAPCARKTDAATVAMLDALPEAIARHHAASMLLSEGEAEVPMYWTETVSGVEVQCKGLADWLVTEPTIDQASALKMPWDDGCQPILCDVKTVRSLDGIQRQAAGYLYHGQLAHYAAGVRALTGRDPAVYLLAVSKAAPYDVAVLRLDTTDALQAGERLRQSLLARLVTCETLDRWPGAYPGVTDLHLPGWAKGAEVDDDFTFEED